MGQVHHIYHIREVFACDLVKAEEAVFDSRDVKVLQRVVLEEVTLDLQKSLLNADLKLIDRLDLAAH